MNRKPQNKQPIAEDGQNFFREVEVEFLVHELKDPISIVETCVRALLERREKYGALSSSQEKILKRALRGTRKARGMVYNMLEIGRSEAGYFDCGCFHPAAIAYEVLLEALEVTPGNISERCRECEGENEVLQLLSDSGIFLDISPRLVQTEAYQDETKFRHILGNLIKNALHHRKARVEIRMDQADNSLLIEVTDDGPGIDSKYRETIFRRYAQIQGNECRILQRKGHGLGLAGALILTRCLGGNIELNSKKGKGATFRLILPVTFKEAVSPDTTRRL
ncbi:sensor histidine kinase [Desulfococcaceae bacterium HSG8]|nr:sensor histidine kinase [Desulfococcaceae bacterium HSG8]